MKDLSIEEENIYEGENERTNLKKINEDKTNNNKPLEKNPKQKYIYKIYIKILTTIFSLIVVILFYSIIIFLISKYHNLYNKKNKYNLRSNINNNSSSTNNNKGIISKENYNKNEGIQNQNYANRKIGIAFVYKNLYSNGIARFITVTSKYLLETGKYNIFYITDKPYHKEFSYSPEIKRFIAFNNYSLITNISKHEKIDIVILQNVLSSAIANFYRSLGMKVITILHGAFMSALFTNHVELYRYWEQFDSFDSFIFLLPDDYFFYKRLGFKNEIFVPNLYTFEPAEVQSSNLTKNNIVILGRLNDLVKGVKYAIQAMKIIVKKVPKAKLYLVSSDSRVQFLKNLTRDLNLTKNIIFKPNTFNLTKLFLKSSVHMYTSLTEAFPMALVEGKAHGLPVVGFKVPYSIPYQKGFIGVNLFDVKGLAKKTIKLLKDYNYRKRKGEEAKKSLDIIKNNETVNLWGRLFDSLLSIDKKDYRKLQGEIEKKYYNDSRARKHLESQFNILLNHTNHLICHYFDNFTNINYLRTIQKCNVSILDNNIITNR